jgi:hypothetical protein
MIQLPFRFCLTLLMALVGGDLARAADADTTKATDPNPTLVTIHAANQPLADIVKTIATQTDMPVSAGFGAPAAPVSLDEDKQPFWNVIDDLCKRSNTSLVPTWNGQPQLMLQFTGLQTGVQQIISGPILLRFQGIQHVDRLTAAPDQQDSCEVTGTAMWEPRLEVLFTEAWTAPSIAEDENGVSLIPDDSAPGTDPNGYLRGQSPYGRFTVSQRFNNGPAFQRDLQVRLHVPSNAGRRVKNLEGKWKLFVAGKTDHFEVTPIANKRQASYSFGELGSMKMGYAQANDDTVQMQFTLPGGGTGANGATVAAATRNCLLQSMHARVVDAEGQLWGDTKDRANNGGQVNIGMGGNETYINMFIQRDAAAKGKPVKVIIEGPVTATEIDAPFALHDLPLP